MKVRFTPQPEASDISRGVKVPYAPGKRKAAPWRWYLILALVSSPFVYLLYTMLYPVVMITAPGFIHLDKEMLTASSEGVVKAIYARVGDRVVAGQVLVELTSPRLEERIQETRAAITRSRTPPDKTTANVSGPGQGLVTLYRQQLAEAEQVVARQRQRVEVVRRLFAQGAATAAEVNALSVQLEAARHTVIQARLDLKGAELKNLAPAGGDSEPMSERGQLREQLARLLEQQQSMVLQAPRDGILMDTPVEIGKKVAPSDLVALIGVPTHPHVLAYMSPRSVNSARPGQLATVRIPGGPSMEARVREQPSQARRLPADFSSVIGARDIMLLVTLDFNEPLPPERAVEGLPVDVRFHRF